MIGRTLITTADTKTWPANKDEPVLFLGEWCKRFSQKEMWEKLNAQVVEYHWDDRGKLASDYRYLQCVYETLLFSLSKKLNDIHSVDYSVRYWRILVGPWLGIFVQILFDRWTSINDALMDPAVNKCNIFDRDPLSVVPNGMQEFGKLYVEDDWNESIYAQLLQAHFSDRIKLTKIPLNERARRSIETFKKGLFFEKKHLLKQINNLLNRALPKSPKFFFLSSYLPPKTEFLLQISLLQFPRMWRSNVISIVKPSKIEREWYLDSGNESVDIFEKIAASLISSNLPTCYLEGYKALLHKAKDQNWPLNPKAIFTANADISDDIFKLYAAQKAESGTSIVIAQHGGHYGMTPFYFTEDHQVKIADKWLSWGWSDSLRPNIVPVGNLKAAGKSMEYDDNGVALMVGCAFPRFSYYLYAVPIAGQWLNYFEDQKTFVKALPGHIRKKLIIKVFPVDFGWDQEQRYRSEIGGINISSEGETIPQLVRKSRLYISTYNATTYLESLSSNIPTIIFWNTGQWEIKVAAEPYFELLKVVGIFHETPESAALHVSKIWNNIPAWWESDPVQLARTQFCEKYSVQTGYLVKDIREILLALSRS